jgi:hypothetical protein
MRGMVKASTDNGGGKVKLANVSCNRAGKNSTPATAGDGKESPLRTMCSLSWLMHCNNRRNCSHADMLYNLETPLLRGEP